MVKHHLHEKMKKKQKKKKQVISCATTYKTKVGKCDIQKLNNTQGEQNETRFNGSMSYL